MVEPKLPDPDPERHIGRWEMTMSHELYRIAGAEKTHGGTIWFGKALQGDRVLRSSVPSLLTQADCAALDALLDRQE